MAKFRMVEVAQQLLSRAKAAKVAWKEGYAKDSYLVTFPDMSLAISRLSLLPSPPPLPPGLPPLPDLSKVLSAYGYKLELRDESGKVIESLAAIPGDPEYRVLREIFELAEPRERSIEANIEGTIDKVLDYLKRP